VRNDTGVFEGGEISMYYDPMIAKLCTWGRTAARDRGDALALDTSRSRGSATTCPSVRR
jgi:propionyl-CoA carboxylase alpha chain